MEKELTEQQPQDSIKIVTTWSQVVVLALMVGFVYYHSISGHPLAIAFVCILSMVTAFFSAMHLVRAYVGAYPLVMGVLTENPLSVAAVRLLYPFTWPRLANATVYAAVAGYLYQFGLWPVSIILIAPFILSILVYNRICRIANNAEVQQTAVEHIKFLQDQEKRNAIFQEELDKVMPEIWERVEKRFKEHNILLENIQDESDESGEPDQRNVSTTDEDQRP